jgi:YggT family protein
VILLANLLNGLAIVVDMILSMAMWMLIISALISWVNPDPFNPIVRFLHAVTQPLLKPIRRLVPPLGGRIDISPIILIIVIVFLQAFLVGSMKSYARVILMDIG